MDTNKLPPKVEDFLEKYLDDKLGPAIIKHFTSVVEDKLQVTQKKTSVLSRLEKRYSEGGFLGFATDAYKSYKAKKNAPTAIEQTDADKTSKTTSAAVPTSDSPPPATNLIVPEQLKTGEPATASNKEEKHLIKGEGNVILIGGITPHGVEDLARKLPKALKPVLDDFFKRLSGVDLKTNIKGSTPPAPPKEDGNGEGLLGTALDFFKKKKGTMAGDFARNRKAAQLRKARSLRTTSNALKTTATTGVESGVKAAVTTGVESEAKTAVTAGVESGVKAATTGAETAVTAGAESGAKTAVTAGAESGVKAATTGAEASKSVLATSSSKIGKATSLVSTAGKSVKNKIASSIAKRIPKAMLGALGKSVPFLGALIGGGFAIGRLVKGDIVGAGLEAVSGLGSAATAIPATALLVAKDVYEDAYGVKPESDPEVGKRFTEVKEETTKAATDFVKGVGEKNKPKEGKEQVPSGSGTAPTVTPASPEGAATPSSTPTVTPASPEGAATTVTASTPATPPAIQSSVPTIQPVAEATPTTTSTTDDSKVLNDISSNTGKTNDLISSLTQAIYKLAQNAGGGKIVQPPNNTIVNNDQSSPGPTASEVMANNDDPIRQIRSKYTS
jgi:hypothetical protein